MHNIKNPELSEGNFIVMMMIIIGIINMEIKFCEVELILNI